MKENDKRFVELAISKLSHPITGVGDSRDGATFESLRNWYEEKGFLTPKQLQLITDIFERN